MNPPPPSADPAQGKLAFRPRRDRRFRTCVSAALALHLLLLAPSLLQWGGCRHDRPLGLPGGSGDKIAKGTPEGALNAKGSGKGGRPEPKKQEETVRARTAPTFRGQIVYRPTERQHFMQRFSRDGLLAMLESPKAREVETSREARAATALDSVGQGGMGAAGPLGLPNGVGTGLTAAGSPFGSRVGAKLWLYRLKYNGGDWDANPRALPSLLREVHLALNVPVASKQETITLDDLPNHRGDFMPSMLFMTGTGTIEAGEKEKQALRDYLLGGGMLVGDSSGGAWEEHFVRFMASVLPGKKFRPIELDHDVFRGKFAPYKLPNGCPIYRDHGSNEAKGIFADDNRLVVFLSPGDMGSAWAVVELGRKRGAVEQSFQMGTNLVAYSLVTVRDVRK